MRRLLLATALLTAGLMGSTPASATVDCPPIGPVPGYGPVCTAQCVLNAVDGPPNPPPPRELVQRLIDLVTVVCPR